MACCFGSVLIVLLLGAALFLIGLPALLDYVASLDRQPVVDLHPGEPYAFGGGELWVVGVEDPGCPVDGSCLPAGTVVVTFELLPSGTTFALTLMETEAGSELYLLPGGYVIRLLAVRPFPDLNQPDLSQYVVRVQFIAPPERGET